ncbi:ComEA family DNA-binding protein [Psychromonas sp. Urea-02u-13]|uniref:ComEA family DNA-binding protein n=1 Tax=Psychromonas sp. Urea-02u-13 TaxID=2058326 RepID=UPI000C34E36F|nr:helix-hairpin-helix domain-containing protein [Psychromonas sp. Urea-02u-13]PKG37496.1 competence protein ComEA [Psychromonas sp. Urea-02u-13]
MFQRKFTRLFLIFSFVFIPLTYPILSIANTESVTDIQSGIEKININNADVNQLALIKGIGSKKAQEIIDYRADNGDFSSLDELIRVKGIGAKTLGKIKPYLSI